MNWQNITANINHVENLLEALKNMPDSFSRMSKIYWICSSYEGLMKVLDERQKTKMLSATCFFSLITSPEID